MTPRGAISDVAAGRGAIFDVAAGRGAISDVAAGRGAISDVAAGRGAIFDVAAGRGAIFDIDGVVIDTPHERAWREALAPYADPARLTPALYRSAIAGRPRRDGARAALAALGIPQCLAEAYAAAKQARFLELVGQGAFHIFPDAPPCLVALRQAGWRLAAASSSKNASAILASIPSQGATLLDLFHADLCGRDVPAGKPDPALFLLAAAELGLPPAACLVVEDAPAGIEAARRAGMASLGIARADDAPALHAAGADRVVASLAEFTP